MKRIQVPSEVNENLFGALDEYLKTICGKPALIFECDEGFKMRTLTVYSWV
jgi:hypothetical protein